MQSHYHQPQPDDLSSEADEFASCVATIDAGDSQPDIGDVEWTGPCCEKCQAPMTSDVVAICRDCGWYASLGTFVEVDPNWETHQDADEPAAPAPRPSHLKVWLDLLPRWSWVIIGTVLAIVVESVLVRLATPAGSGLRTAWSLGQLVAGISAFLGAHIFNFVVLSADDADFGVMDLALKPLKLWIRAGKELPTRLWVVNTAASGVTAATMSVLVIGGIPYERLWDWGFEPPVKQELMGAVMDRVKELDNRKGADNLEDAIGDFAGTQDGLTDPPEPRHKADCVVLGYQVDREGRLKVLVLGTTHLGRLVYAGNVTPKMPNEERAMLLQQLARIKAGAPLIPIQSDSTVWVKPKYTCRVSCAHKEMGRLSEIEWGQMLGSIDTPSR